MKSTVLPSAWLRVRLAGLVAWVVGVQTLEALATVGLVVTALSVLPELRRIAWRGWWPLGAWLGWSLVVPSLTGAFPTGTGVARALDWVALPLVGYAVWTVPSRRLLVLALGVTLALSCLVAGLQHVGAWPPLEAFEPWRWTKLPFERVYEPVPGSEGRFMAGGLIFHRLKFAHVSALAVVALAVAGARAGSRRDRWLAWGLAALATGCVWVFPHARMASLALLGALLVAVGLLSPRRRLALGLVALLITAAVATAVVVDSVRDRLASALTVEGGGHRGELLASGVRAVESHPLVGVGLGQFRPSKFPSAEMPQHVFDNPGKTHNQLLSMAAEVGVPGAVLFCLLLASLAWRAWKTPDGVLTLSALTLFVGLSLAHDPLFQPTFSMAIVLALGAGLRAPATRTEGGQT
ncbi:MAG: O-antigen ligase family protein [Myxococcaceae bacterium]|nr:O-antigen ligase family protein [Myxococcaceae bacterium]